MQSQVRTLCKNEQSYLIGQKIFMSGHVTRIWAESEFSFGARVDTPLGQRRVIIHLNEQSLPMSGACSKCAPHGSEEFCEHMVAASFALEPTRRREQLSQRQSAELGAKLLGFFEQPLLKEESLQLEVHLQVQGDGPPRIAFRVGVSRLYVVRDIHAFLQAYYSGQEIEFGKNTTIDPNWQSFSEQDEQLLSFIYEITKSRFLATTQGVLHEKSLPLTQAQLAFVLDHLMGHEFYLVENGRSVRLPGVRQLPIEASVSFSSLGQAVDMRVQLPAGFEKISDDGRFVRTWQGVHKLPQEQYLALQPLLSGGQVYSCRFTREEGELLLSELIPHLGDNAKVYLDDGLRQRIEYGELLAKVYLDAKGLSILARVEFLYGERVIDPFSPAKPPSPQQKLLLRDSAGERRVLDMLGSYGFRVRPGQAHLTGAQEAYAFLLEGVERLNDVAQVFSTKTLLGLRPKRLPFKGKVSIGRIGLEFSLEIDGLGADDKQLILESLIEKKRYVRLKNGRFLSLEPGDGWEKASALFEQMDFMQDGSAIFQFARSAYLPELLGEIDLNIELDERVRSFADAFLNPEKISPPIKGLRPYQKRGFAWLHALAKGRMGGVLADDMGLGKTIQVLALFVQAKKEETDPLPFLVVAPTSLVYNWQAEISRFAKNLSCLVLSGDRNERKKSGQALANVDVLIISYAQMRRDIDWLQELDFRYVVLDEAQQIKNASSIGAGAAKKLRADAKFALTGTPMENHLSELWSIFDYCLPGYLGEQSHFLQTYEGGSNAELLRARLRPFLLRRVKKDVLKELPEKLEEQIISSFAEEQREVYEATLEGARTQLRKASLEGTLSRSNFQVLAALTKLRQICCHPSLCFENYTGSSGKLELCMDLVSSLVSGGHRILLFSQFTSMLSIIKKALEEEGIDYLYLDGSTPAKDRLALADRFNGGSAPVFLISLRAGGFGLNLTAADTVIHYDPWWNPAVEDQATDRAHRIGQLKNVSVFKLIAKDTIEEKVAKLQERKKALVDAVIQPGDAVPEGMSAEEILSLFN